MSTLRLFCSNVIAQQSKWGGWGEEGKQKINAFCLTGTKEVCLASMDKLTKYAQRGKERKRENVARPHRMTEHASRYRETVQMLYFFFLNSTKDVRAFYIKRQKTIDVSSPGSDELWQHGRDLLRTHVAQSPDGDRWRERKGESGLLLQRVHHHDTKCPRQS